MWNSQQIQIVWFVISDQPPSAQLVYEGLVQNEPNGTETQKTPSARTPFLSKATGNGEGVQYEVLVAPNRVDFFVRAKDASDDMWAAFDTERWLNWLHDRVKQIELFPELVVRQSVVVHMIKPTSSLGEAERAISELVPLKVEISDLRDLSLQLNKRRKFAWDSSVEMNRIMNFHTINTQIIVVQANAEQRKIQTNPIMEHGFAAGLKLDINVVQTKRFFNLKEQKRNWDELFEDTKKLAKTRSIEDLKI